MSEAKYCTFCKTHTHSDEECPSTRPADWWPLPDTIITHVALTKIKKVELTINKPNVCGNKEEWNKCKYSMNTYPGCSVDTIVYVVCPYGDRT